ncbi:hypothetical protein OK074_5007 [Actinobacteria bacterium OK074]|nr:hypothetical protein OK074_5007 [Actinobacteria bacterium OK074]
MLVTLGGLVKALGDLAVGGVKDVEQGPPAADVPCGRQFVKVMTGGCKQVSGVWGKVGGIYVKGCLIAAGKSGGCRGGVDGAAVTVPCGVERGLGFTGDDLYV